MSQLIMILSFMLQHGITLKDIEIETISERQSMYVYDCHGFVDKDATILACINEKKIIIIR